MPMQVILLEHVDNLGNLGDIVKVKPGYARNFLIPQSKALRATDDNIAYFEAQKKEIEKKNEERKKEAAKDAKKLEGLKVAIIRHASESGQLYGSVAARDIAEAVTAKSGLSIGRSQVVIHDSFKTIGLFPVTVALHAEVKVDVTINVARSEDEAQIQEKTGKALIAEEEESIDTIKVKAEQELEDMSAKKDMLEESAFEAEREEEERRKAEEAEEQERAAKRAAKKAAKADEAEEEAEAESAEAAESESEEEQA